MALIRALVTALDLLLSNSINKYAYFVSNIYRLVIHKHESIRYLKHPSTHHVKPDRIHTYTPYYTFIFQAPGRRSMRQPVPRYWPIGQLWGLAQ